MILVAGMAFWGADQGLSVFRQNANGSLASAGGRNLLLSSIDRQVENFLRDANQQSPEPITKQSLMERGDIDALVDAETGKISALAYANSVGLAASTDAIVAELRKFDAFKNALTGELDPEKYNATLAENNYTKKEFEQEIGDQLVIQTLRGAANAAMKTPGPLAAIDARYFGESRDIGWLVMDASAAPKPAEPTEADIKAFYDKSIEIIKEPELRVIDLVQISSADYLHQVAVTEQEVATTYEATKSSRFAELDTRTYIEMIFADREAARTAFGQLAAGADPAQIKGAAATDIKTGNAESVADPAQRAALFGPGKQSGALYGPREVPGGWLVARLVSVQPGAVLPLESVQEQIRMELATERARQLVYEKIDGIDRGLAAGFDFEKIAAEAGVPVMTLAGVSKEGALANGYPSQAILQVPEALAEAFKLREKDTSQVFQTNDGAAAISVRKIIPARTPPLAEVQARIKQALIIERQSEAAQAYADGFASKIKSGALTLAQAAKQTKSLQTVPAQRVTRQPTQEMGPIANVLGNVFKAEVGDVLTLPAGGSLYVLLHVRGANQPTEAELIQLQDAASIGMNQALGADLQAAFDAELAKATKVRRNTAALEAYKASIKGDQ